MLDTPMGRIQIKIDGILKDYDSHEVPQDKTCGDIDGRYVIKILFIPDGRTHTICCCIRDYIPSKEDGIEPGEKNDKIMFIVDEIK